MADGCIKLQDKLGTYTEYRVPIYKDKEEKIKEILLQMPTSGEIKEMLSAIGLNIDEFYQLYGKNKIQNAILYAKDLKDRYTILWLNYELFGNGFLTQY